jgi:anti-sigma-K factor RsiG
VELLPDLSTLSDPELDRMLQGLEREEDSISQRRRILHGRIDILRAERVARLKTHVADGDLTLPSPDALAAGALSHAGQIFEGTGELPEEHEIEPMPDLGTITDDDLRELIGRLEHEEDDVSLERRVLHGRIDILRAERTRRRRGGAWDPDSIAEVLSHGAGASPPDAA